MIPLIFKKSVLFSVVAAFLLIFDSPKFIRRQKFDYSEKNAEHDTLNFFPICDELKFGKFAAWISEVYNRLC